MRNTLITINLVAMGLFLLLSCSHRPNRKASPTYEENKRLNVTVKDDEDNPVEDATITMVKKGWLDERTTNQDGSTTFEKIYKLPFELRIQHGESYIPETITVAEDDFPNNKRVVDIPIILERKKTIIKGRIIDKETNQPIPEPVTITTYPYEIFEKTKKDGTYRIASAEFEKGDEIEINAKVKNYTTGLKTITITNYLGENVVPEISLERIAKTDSTVIAPDDSIIIRNNGTTGIGSQ